MDPDEFNIAGDFFLYSPETDGERRKSIYERFQRFVPAETIAYIQYCLLRLPFVLLYDYLLTEHFSSLTESLLSRTLTLIFGNDQLLHRSAFHWLFQANFAISVPLIGLIFLIFCLWCSDRCLVMFYSYTISLFVIYFDYQMTSLPENSPSSSSLTMCIFQLILSSIYTQMLNIRPRVGSHPSQTRLCHFAPVALLIARYCLPSNCTLVALRAYYSLWTLVHLSESFVFHFRPLVHLVRHRFVDEHFHLYRNFGLRTFVTYLHAQISVWTLLKIFWLTKIIVLPLALRTVEMNFQLDETLFSTSLFYGTETIFTLISLACLVSHVMKTISFRLFRLLHLWSDEVEQIGTLVGVLFFLFLFQSNITTFDVPCRHVPLIEAFCLLIVALFHFVHTILEPALVKAAMQTITKRIAFGEKSASILRAFHHEHIYTCASICLLLGFDLFLLWRIGEVSTWLFAVTTFTLELLVRLVASFAQFTIYVLDAHQRFRSANAAEKFLLRLKTLTSTCEVLLGAFLLLNGVDILLFDVRGFLRAFILLIHGYLNIVKNLRRACRFLRDRRTVRQLNSATDEQIVENNDVCPICYEMFTVETTCVTPCSHLFHRSCLEKAFAKSTRCALCSRSIVSLAK